MANTATRLITLIMLLQRQPNQTAAQLARVLDVSVRTVQRYITMLDEMGIETLMDLLAEQPDDFEFYAYTKAAAEIKLTRKQIRILRSVHFWLIWETNT